MMKPRTTLTLVSLLAMGVAWAGYDGIPQVDQTHINDRRDGKENDATFGRRMTGSGPYAWTIGRRFELACARLGINRDKIKLATDAFRRPPQPGEQLALL